MTLAWARRLGWAAIVLVASGLGAAAQQPLRCSGFIHDRDGAWRSFDEADLLGPDGPVHVRPNEPLRPSDRSAKGGIARALNELCEPR